MRKGGSGCVAARLVAMAVCVSPALAADRATPERWSWLADTYWYVPKENLLALASSPALSAPIPVSDQTVYHIERYRAGYFWGTTAVSYRHGPGTPRAPACLQLVGSVTPEGRVHLTFTPLLQAEAGGGFQKQPTVGLGVMTEQRGEWTMENQMSTEPVGNVLLTHWAYMHRCTQGQPCFSSLPGIEVSLPEFLAACAKPAAQPAQ